MTTAHQHRRRLNVFGAAVAAAVLAGTATATAAPPPEGPIQATAGAIPDRYIVTLADRAAAVDTSAATLTRSYGGQVKFTYERTVRGFSVQMSERQARRLAADPRVASVEEVGVARIAGTQPNAPWGLDRIDQRDLPLNQTYNYPDNAGRGATVYVLDTGTRRTHRDFTGRISAGRDFIDNDNDASDCHGHGTHVAGSAAGTTYGVAKQAQIVPIRVLDCAGSGGWDVILAGVEYVTANAAKPAVANMSLGGTGTQTALENGIRRSIASGVTYALAAGNNGADACGFSPARVAEAITVGNSTSTDARYVGVGTSNYGRCLDLFAPGTSIVSAGHSSDTATATMTGTSMASPHTAGAAALYLAANPSATPQQVRDALVTNGTTGKITNPGTGSPNVLLYTGFITGDPGPGNPSVTNPGNQSTVVNTPVSLQLQAAGGATPYRWSATGLPAGLSIDSGTGRVSGTPTVEGSSTVTVSVTDAENKTASTTFTWAVTATGGGCGTGHARTVTGTVSSGGNQYQPSAGFQSAAGAQRANLCGPDGTDFDLYLQRWNGSTWTTVASSTSPDPDEAINYTGTAGLYRYRVHAYDGSGNYTLSYTNP